MYLSLIEFELTALSSLDTREKYTIFSFQISLGKHQIHRFPNSISDNYVEWYLQQRALTKFRHSFGNSRRENFRNLEQVF